MAPAAIMAAPAGPPIRERAPLAKAAAAEAARDATADASCDAINLPLAAVATPVALAKAILAAETLAYADAIAAARD